MKARRVKGVDAAGPLRENLERIIRVRADELRSFVPLALDPREVEALHDMRIAAKRLRYILELTEPVFGEWAAAGAKKAKKLQDLLGEIHDCDEFVPRVERHIERLRLEDARSLVAHAPTDAADLEPRAAREAPNRGLYRGLESLVVYLRARRQVLFSRFVDEWGRGNFAVTVGDKEEESLG
jgi:CHAD domain-containing protein